MRPQTIIISTLLAVFMVGVGFALALVTNIILLRRSVPRYAAYWDSQNLASTTDRAITYVALGDSTAQGIGATKPENGYIAGVANYIQSTTGRPVHIINLSKSGARLHDVISTQLPAMNRYQPDIVTLAIGANDMADYNSGTFDSQLATILDRLPITSIVADLPYFGGGRAQSKQDSAESASAYIRGQLASRSLTLAPLEQTTREHDSRRNYGADFYHPSNYGYTFWTQAFVTGLQDAEKNQIISYH